MERIHRLNEIKLEDIILDEKDFHSYMTGGFVIAGRELDLLRLKYLLIQLSDNDDVQGFRLVHYQITPDHLAIVKKEDWRQWIREKK